MSQQVTAETRERILDACLAVFEERGIRAATLAHIAEFAGVGRATLYRHFPGKDALLSSLLLREAALFFQQLDAELAGEDDPSTLLERGMLCALEYARSNRLLQRLLETEPETVLPLLTVRASPLVQATVAFGTPYIERAAKVGAIEGGDPQLAAEWVARILLSLVLVPSPSVDLDDPQKAREYVTWITSKLI